MTSPATNAIVKDEIAFKSVSETLQLIKSPESATQDSGQRGSQVLLIPEIMVRLDSYTFFNFLYSSIKMDGKIKTILTGFCIISILSACKTNQISMPKTNWEPSRILADGNLGDWKLPLRYYSNESKISYTLSNDSTNLYVCMRISDPITQMKILRAGMDFSIDTAGKYEPQFRISYPLQKGISEGNPEGMKKTMRENGRSADHSEMNGMKRLLLAEQVTMSLSGFKDQQGEVPIRSKGIQVAMGLDSFGILNYEAMIPMGSFYKSRISPLDTSKAFGFIVLVKGMKMASRSTSGGGGRSGSGGGMGGGGRSGGGMGGGGRSGGGGMGGGRRSGGGDQGGDGSAGSNAAAMSETATQKVKFRLNLN